MKKKLGVLMLALIMIVVSVAGCSSGSTSKSNQVTKVGFLYVGPADDGGWSQVHDQGRAKMVEHSSAKLNSGQENVIKKKGLSQRSAIW